MKRILIFSLAYYPNFVSGAEVAIKEITDRIDDIEFCLITLRFSDEPRKEKIGNVQVYRVGWGGGYLSKILFVPAAAAEAIVLNREKKFDALWAMMSYMTFPIVLGRMVGLRIPYALTLQDGDPYEKVFGRWYIRPFAWIIDAGIRQATIIQTISTYLATWPRKRGYKGPVEIIYNGASLQSGEAIDPQEIEALKRSLGKKEGDVFLVSVSRLVHQKAIDTVIRALALLPRTIRCIVVGDGEERAMLEHLAGELDVQDRVTFVGQVDRSMTAKYRKASDIFVLPSRSEGQGISFASTMLAGLPIVATQEGGIADFLFDARRNPDKPTTGFAVDKDNPAQIAAAVVEILGDKKRALRVAETARQYAREHFDWDAIAKAMRARVFSRALS